MGPYSVYRLLNHSTQEAYFGITKESKDVNKDYLISSRKELEDWDCETDDVNLYFLHKDLSRELASELVKEYEEKKYQIPNSYHVIRAS